MSLRSLLLDFNSYFASVEQHLRPELRGRPVGVLPVLAETSCCIAASIQAKRCGVKTGTGVADARRLCPDIVFVQARPRIYVEMHHRLMGIVDTVIAVSEVLSIDEVACDLTGSWQQEGVVREVEQYVYDQVPNIVLTYPNTIEAYRTDKVAGLTPGPEGDGYLLPNYVYTSMVNAHPVQADAGSSTSSTGSSGIPTWVWAAVAVVVIGVGVVLVRRSRGASERDERD